MHLFQIANVLAVKSRTEKAQVYEYLHPLFCFGSIKSYESVFFLGPFKSCNNILFHPCTVLASKSLDLLGAPLRCRGTISIVGLKNCGMCGDHQCEQCSSSWSSWLCARRLFRFSPACHVPGGITTTTLAFGLIAPDDAHHLPIIARSSLHPPSHHWPTALLSLFNLCGHLLLFRHPFSLDDTQDLVSKWPSTSESNMYGLCFCLVRW